MRARNVLLFVVFLHLNEPTKLELRRLQTLARLALSAALAGVLAVPKSFQSKCKFHQPLNKKTDISIRVNVSRGHVGLKNVESVAL